MQVYLHVAEDLLYQSTCRNARVPPAGGELKRQQLIAHVQKMSMQDLAGLDQTLKVLYRAGQLRQQIAKAFNKIHYPDNDVPNVEEDLTDLVARMLDLDNAQASASLKSLVKDHELHQFILATIDRLKHVYRSDLNTYCSEQASPLRLFNLSNQCVVSTSSRGFCHDQFTQLFLYTTKEQAPKLIMDLSRADIESMIEVLQHTRD